MSILDRNLENDRIKTMSGDMVVTSLYTAGLGGEKFLRALQNEAELVGSYCATCKKAFLPLRHFCERCMTRLTDTVTAPSTGILASFTKVHIDMDNKPLTAPRWIGFFQFKGFEGGIVHNLKVSSEKKLRIGKKVKPVFQPKAKRKGSILDISHFELN